jgi:urease accessory protein
MQLSDGTLPIGATAHSFGLESLAEWDMVRPSGLEAFLESYLQEQAPVDCCYLRAAFAAGRKREKTAFLCRRLDALRQARESRDASVSLGQRLMMLASGIVPSDPRDVLQEAFRGESTHQVLVFGYLSALLGFDEDTMVAAFLQQTLAAIVSTAQRLMPVGQRQATALQWSLKSRIVAVMETSRGQDLMRTGAFMPLLDIGSMRHPRLETRLFLS